MNTLQTVTDLLKHKNITASTEHEMSVVWKDSAGIKNSVSADNIAVIEGKTAWFQSDENDSNERFVIFENERFFEFPPKTEHYGYGCDIYLVEWFRDHLILIYHEKHNVVISSVKDQNITTLEFHGDELVRRGDLLYFRDYGLKDSVRRLKIPEMTELESISVKEATDQDAVPETLGYLNDVKSK
ncbi:hypothetical protein [Chryseobacterium sp.]|uniref:hypothetical protein n=1 Tax=Chryseobacterium sp. TaxID=1871047 RepID=UPI00289CB5B8|nr:hypothetical protein [Chryseobacterium sp.]